MKYILFALALAIIVILANTIVTMGKKGDKENKKNKRDNLGITFCVIAILVLLAIVLNAIECNKGDSNTRYAEKEDVEIFLNDDSIIIVGSLEEIASFIEDNDIAHIETLVCPVERDSVERWRTSKGYNEKKKTARHDKEEMLSYALIKNEYIKD